MSKEVWSDIWRQFQKDPETILKHTRVDNGFAGDCYQEIKRRLPNTAKKVLEVGCGTGRFLIKLAEECPNIYFEGSDLSEKAVQLAQAGAKLRGLKNVVFQPDDMTRPKPKYDQYDYIYNEGSVEHFRGKQDLEVLKTLLKLVKPDGIFMFGVPNHRCYVHTINKTLQGPFYRYGFERSYKREQLEKYLNELGLSEQEIKGVGLRHGWQRYGFPYTLFVKRYEKMLKANKKRAEHWNDKYGFFLFASGKKVK